MIDEYDEDVPGFCLTCGYQWWIDFTLPCDERNECPRCGSPEIEY